MNGDSEAGTRYFGTRSTRRVSHNRAQPQRFTLSSRFANNVVGDMALAHTKEVEVRRKPRRRILEFGLIRFGEYSVACVLRNFSEIGAALDVGVKDFIPDRFTLIVVPKKKIISCNVVWRKGTRIGVSFC
jgi:hypothetical protein